MRSLQLVLLLLTVVPALAQFELPVQLVGFPVIIIAVRIANFIKKLSYALNPNTYRSRPRRHSDQISAQEVTEVEKKLVTEMGEKVCVYDRVCADYALNSLQPYMDAQLDWDDIFRKFATSPKDDAEFYLLSIFLGDIVGSPQLCHQLAKRRPCGRSPRYGGLALAHHPSSGPGVSVSWQYYYAPNAPSLPFTPR